MAVLGNKIIVYRDGVAIAGTRSNDVGTLADDIPTASRDTGDWQTRLPGRKDWSVNVGFLVLSEAGIEALLSIGTEYTLVFRGASGGVTGKALMTECRITANLGTLVAGSFAFKGNGAMSLNT